MNLIAVIFIITTIILYRKNKDLKKENKELKEEQNIFCPNCGYHLTADKEKIYYDIKQKEKEPTKPKEKHTEKEIKNSLILITGSILIIISAIFFLTTTWNITHNFIKTIVIILMLFVFLEASHIADKYLNLKQTSKTFFYIALAYIPIILISISLFSLLGNYLSIYGEGKYIYFTLSSILTTIIYYQNAKKNNSKLLEIASIIFSIISVFFLTRTITGNSTTLLIALSIYTIILTILYDKRQKHITPSILSKTIKVLIPSLTIIMIHNNFWSILHNEVTIIEVLLEISMLYLIYYYLVNIKKKEKIFNIILPIYIILTCLTFAYLFPTFIVKQILTIISFLIIYLYDMNKNKKISTESIIEITIAGIILYNVTIMNKIVGIKILPTYSIPIVIFILSLICYNFTNKENKKISAYILTASLIITIIDILTYYSLSINYLLIISLIIIITSMFYIKDNNLSKAFNHIGNITFLIGSIYNSKAIILYIIYLIITFYYSRKKKDDNYKILSYIYLNYVFLTLLQLFSLDTTENIIRIIPFTTIFLNIIEEVYPVLDNKANNKYIMFQFIVSYVLLFTSINIINILLVATLNYAFIIYIQKHNYKEKKLIIPLIFSIPHIYNHLLVFNTINITYIISILVLILMAYLIYKKKTKLYIIFFFIYALSHIINFNETKYISLLIIALGTYVIYLIKENKTKDLLKAFLFLEGLQLVKYIIVDLNLNNISILRYGPYILCTILITRLIEKKYSENYKKIEYIFLTIINYLAISNYISEFDGILFVLLLTALVIISYMLKLGPIFLTSLIFILINVLLLTKTFWLNIPWWIYILLVGSILIGFAIYNEINTNKKPDKINKIKDDLDI